MTTYRKNQVTSFLQLIRNFKLDVVDEGLNIQKLSVFKEVLLNNILIKVAEFGFSSVTLKKIELSLLKKEYWDGLEVSYLEKKLLEIFFLNKKSPCILMIDSQGKIMNDNHINNVIVLDLKKHFKSMISRFPFSKSYPVLDFIESEEQKVLKLIRNNDFDSVKVIKRNGKLDRAESTQLIDTSKKVSEIMKDAKFQDIEIRQESGKTVYISRIIKTKLN